MRTIQNILIVAVAMVGFWVIIYALLCLDRGHREMMSERNESDLREMQVRRVYGDM